MVRESSAEKSLETPILHSQMPKSFPGGLLLDLLKIKLALGYPEDLRRENRDSANGLGWLILLYIAGSC